MCSTVRIACGLQAGCLRRIWQFQISEQEHQEQFSRGLLDTAATHRDRGDRVDLLGNPCGVRR